MGFLEQLSDGLGSALVEQIKSKGLVILILFLGLIALIFRTNDDRSYLMEDVRNTKAENKELQRERNGEIIAKLNLILEGQREMKANQATLLENDRREEYKTNRNGTNN